MHREKFANIFGKRRTLSYESSVSYQENEKALVKNKSMILPINRWDNVILIIRNNGRLIGEVSTLMKAQVFLSLTTPKEIGYSNRLIPKAAHYAYNVLNQ